MAATTFLVLALLAINMAMASVYDCWDPEKLSRMNFPVSPRKLLFEGLIISKVVSVVLDYNPLKIQMSLGSDKIHLGDNQKGVNQII